jgi:hypothetical protein
MAKPKGPKWIEIKDNPKVEERRYDCLYRGCRGNGRTYVTIKCPFCGWKVDAYVWSLCGGGKRCGCGALFGSTGTAYHYRGQPSQNFCGDADSCTCAREIGYRVCAEKAP